MTQKTKARIALTAFLAVCLIPSAGMLLLPQEAAAANQTLAQPPRLFLEDGSFNTRVLDEVTDYVADHFAFRQEMITASAQLDAAVFQVSNQGDVVLGKEDWLFYQETMADYLRTEPLSGQQLFGAARTLALLQEYAAARGAKLYVTVAPNKASLYPEYLPNVGEPLEGESNVDRLRPYLEGEGVSYLDLFAPFQQEDEVLYYRTDSHWNVRGAALAHDALVAGLGKTDQEPFFSGTYHQGEPHLGDLYEMLYPTGTETEEDAAYDRPFAFSYVRPIRSAEDQFIQTENPDRSGSLLMFRDSFGNLLHTFLADAYGQAAFSRAMPYTMSLLDQTGADTVLIEIVERNLDWWATQAPIFPAPERVLTGTPPAGEAQVQYAVTEDGLLPGYVRLEGRLTGAVDENSPVYVKLGERLYEACPVGVAGKGTPFTLYIPQDEAQLTPEILYQSDGQLQTTGAVR